ncbi:DNA polymerase IV [Criblamydia sequanensis]|nr:DNA polymerase IV [Criblamydia sequanensis]
MKRIILHIDMDAFFASIEIAENPHLKGLPIIVGGNPDRRGVVSTCSYEARVYGVHSAMPLHEAKKLCPKAIFITGNYSLYKNYSEKIMKILTKVCPIVEIVSIDEAYLDFTNFVDEEHILEIGQEIKNQIFYKTGLTSSIGIGSCKLISKMASSFQKPNGLLQIKSGLEVEFLKPLDIGKLPGVGTKTEEHLRKKGFFKISDLQEASLEKLIDLMGVSRGYYLHKACLGRDPRVVEGEKRSPKSIGKEETFDKDIADILLLQEVLENQLKAIFEKAKERKLRFKGFSIKIRHPDFKTFTKSYTFKNFTQNYHELRKAVFSLFESFYSGSPPLRLLGVSLENLSDGYWQPTFWDDL